MELDLALAGETVGFHARQFPDPTHGLPRFHLPLLPACREGLEWSSPHGYHHLELGEEGLEEDLAVQVEKRTLRW